MRRVPKVEAEKLEKCRIYISSGSLDDNMQPSLIFTQRLKCRNRLLHVAQGLVQIPIARDSCEVLQCPLVAV